MSLFNTFDSNEAGDKDMETTPLKLWWTATEQILHMEKLMYYTITTIKDDIHFLQDKDRLERVFNINLMQYVQQVGMYTPPSLLYNLFFTA